MWTSALPSHSLCHLGPSIATLLTVTMSTLFSTSNRNAKLRTCQLVPFTWSTQYHIAALSHIRSTSHVVQRYPRYPFQKLQEHRTPPLGSREKKTLPLQGPSMKVGLRIAQLAPGVSPSVGTVRFRTVRDVPRRRDANDFSGSSTGTALVQFTLWRTATFDVR